MKTSECQITGSRNISPIINPFILLPLVINNSKNRRKKEGNLYPTFVYKNVTTYQNEIEIIAYSPYLVSLEYIFSNLIVSYNCLNLFENKMDEIIINMTMNPNTYSIENLAFKFITSR